MSHYGDSVVGQAANYIKNGAAALELHRSRAAFLEQPSGGTNGFVRTDLIGHERHVGHDEGAPRAAAHGSRVMDHHVERNGNGVVETEHYHSDGVANEDNVNTGTIEQSRHRRIVGREDRNLRARRLYRPKIGDPNRLHGYREYRKKTKDGVICLHSVCCLSWLPSTLHGSHSIGCQTDNHNDHACNEGSHLLPPFPDVWIFGKPQPFEGIRLANQRKLTHAWKSRIWQLGAGSGSINLFGPARTRLLAQQ